MSTLDESQKQQALQEYYGGLKATEVAEKYGTTPQNVYNWARKEKELAERAQQPGQAAQTPISPIVSAPEGGVCSFFPSRKSNEIHRMAVYRIVTNPPEMGDQLGTGLMLAEADYSFDESAVKESFGGGRYEIRAFNVRGDVIGRTPVKIPGRSKPIEPEADDDEGAIFIQKPQAPAQPNIGPIADIIRESREMTQRQVEAMQRQSDNLVQAIRDGAKERAEQQQQFFAAQVQMMNQGFGQQMEVMRTMMQSQMSAPKSNFMEELEKFQVLRDLVGDKEEKQTTTADIIAKGIEKLPDMMAAIAAARNGDFEPEEMEEDDEAHPVAGAPQPAPQARPQALPLDAAIRELHKSMLASGIPAERAKQLVSAGVPAIKAALTEARRKPAAPIPAPTPAPTPTPSAPKLEVVKEDKPATPPASANGHEPPSVTA